MRYTHYSTAHLAKETTSYVRRYGERIITFLLLHVGPCILLSSVWSFVVSCRPRQADMN